MDNSPLLYCLDADNRRYVPDMTFEVAELRAPLQERYTNTNVVASGVYNGHILTCEEAGGGYLCWISNQWPIGYRTGATPAQAIERAQAVCI